MDLGFLDKSSNVTPLLVRLYDSHKLYGLAKDKKPDARAELTSAVTDLLQLELSDKESELIADVLIELMHQAEKDLREALSERLSVIDTVPLRLILQLVNDDIEVARPVLTNSTVLGDMDLIYIVKSKSAEYWRAIAARKAMSDQVMNVLAETRDLETAIIMAENMHIKLTERVLTIFSDMAQKSEDLAQPLLRREEITDDLVKVLYQYVGQELKTFITKNFPDIGSEVQDVVDDVVVELVETEEGSEFAPRPQMIKAADRYKEKGLLTISLMLGTLRRGQIASFVAQFSRYTGLVPDVVEEILKQKTGQGLAIACKAFEIKKADFVSIYLLTNRVRNDASMVDVKDMTRAVEYFNRVQKNVAQDILQNSLHNISKE